MGWTSGGEVARRDSVGLNRKEPVPQADQEVREVKQTVQEERRKVRGELIRVRCIEC